MYFMVFERIDADDSDNSLIGVSSLDKDYTKMRFESSNSAGKVIGDNVNCQTWNELESELNAEFQHNYGVIEAVTLASGYAIND
jgi:hypothetical protein